MSDFASPDASSTGSEGAETGGKLSFMDKVKLKARDKTKKLKTKLAPGAEKGSEGGEGAGEGYESSSSDEEKKEEKKEKEAPHNNAMTGMTQPQFDRKLKDDPSAFAGGAPGTQGEKDTGEKDLSKDFEGLSTKEKDEYAEPKSESTEADKPVTEKATAGLFGAKDAVAEKAGYGASSGDAPSSQSAAEAVTPSEETKGAAVGYKDQAVSAATDYYNKAAETASAYTGKGTAAAQGDQGATEDLKKDTAETGQTWAAWAAEKVGYGKDVAAEKLPKTEDGTSAPDAAADKAYQAKDVISQKAGEVTDAASAKADETSATQ